MKRTLSQYKAHDTGDNASPGEQIGAHMALPVANGLSQPDGQPVSGAEYLWLVRQEAARCPHIVSAPDRQQQLEACTVASWQRPYTWREHYPSAGEACLPHSGGNQQTSQVQPGWKRRFLAEFAQRKRQFQKYMQNMQQAIEESELDVYRLFPASESSWKHFCYGTDQQASTPSETFANETNTAGHAAPDTIAKSDTTAESYDGVEEDEGDAIAISPLAIDTSIETVPAIGNEEDEAALSAAKARALASLAEIQSASSERNDHPTLGYAPSPCLIALLSQKQALQLIEHHTHWLAEDSAQLDEIGLWLYSLLLRVDDVLTGSEISTLRSLVRQCQASNTASSEAAHTLHILTTIVAGHYAQSDLQT